MTKAWEDAFTEAERHRDDSVMYGSMLKLAWEMCRAFDCTNVGIGTTSVVEGSSTSVAEFSGGAGGCGQSNVNYSGDELTEVAGGLGTPSGIIQWEEPHA